MPHPFRLARYPRRPLGYVNRGWVATVAIHDAALDRDAFLEVHMPHYRKLSGRPREFHIRAAGRADGFPGMLDPNPAYRLSRLCRP
ncbi:MAG: hypothetical protein U9Q79_06880 [Candidatus Hydrogenedentes bacterium]|nr:hypothetical protein [Candidatus Hydrogenedentota bacterium]